MPRAHLFPFPLLRDDMLTMLVCATLWFSMHIYSLAYMSMHESCLLVCCPYFNTMKLWTPDPNLHLSLADTTFCLLAFLFAFLLVGLLPCLPFCLLACYLACLPNRLFTHILASLLAMPIVLICFMPFHMLFSSLLSIAYLLVSCLCLCMYTHGVRTLGARA